MNRGLDQPTRLISAALEKLYRPTSLADFPSRVFEAIKTLAPDLMVTLDEVCTRTGAVRDAASFTHPSQWREVVMATLERDHPGVAYVRGGGTELVLPLWELTSRRLLRETELWQDAFRPLGIKDQVVLRIPVPGRDVGVAVNRDTAFRRHELELFELITPHLQQAYRTAELVTILCPEAKQSQQFPPERVADYQLTVREAEVLQWLVEGKRDREIAVILEISARTVEKHVGRILQKLQVETRAAAISQALAHLR